MPWAAWFLAFPPERQSSLPSTLSATAWMLSIDRCPVCVASSCLLALWRRSVYWAGLLCGCGVMSFLCLLWLCRLGHGGGFYSSSAVWVCVVGQMFLGFVVSLWFLAALFLCSGRSGILFLYKVPIFNFLLFLAICRCSLTALDIPVLSVHVYMPVCV